MARTAFDLEVPTDFQLRSVAYSHGWLQLPPFAWREEPKKLELCGRVLGLPTAADVLQTKSPAGNDVLRVVAHRAEWSPSARRDCRAMLRLMLGLHLDFREFYNLAGARFRWAQDRGVGRFLRGASVFEDAVKLLATTNCSWSLTRLMVGRLVEALGEEAPNGRRAFPTPEKMAEQPESFYRDVVKAGYRARYFREIARLAASGETDFESWASHPGATDELIREIRRAPGCGPYVAECLCKLLGRFDGLGVDSWCRNRFLQLHGPVEGSIDRAIADHYRPFGSWQGLALWLDLTRDWHTGDAIPGGKFVAD